MDSIVLTKVETHYIFLMNVYATFGAAIPHQGVFKVVWLHYHRRDVLHVCVTHVSMACMHARMMHDHDVIRPSYMTWP